jgi:hypothetical protein
VPFVYIHCRKRFWLPTTWNNKNDDGSSNNSSSVLTVGSSFVLALLDSYLSISGYTKTTTTTTFRATAEAKTAAAAWRNNSGGTYDDGTFTIPSIRPPDLCTCNDKQDHCPNPAAAAVPSPSRSLSSSIGTALPITFFATRTRDVWKNGTHQTIRWSWKYPLMAY